LLAPQAIGQCAVEDLLAAGERKNLQASVQSRVCSCVHLAAVKLAVSGLENARVVLAKARQRIEGRAMASRARRTAPRYVLSP
jgi:hypothetical protein